ncbi:hypothetical protein AYN00_00395 [Coxiella burnetii]|nr:hypothetical protein AYM90_00400 [Coxiella burnetii]ATN79362.1 hypothetical protein AYN00_00395 [Coxiella burnetii]OYK92575.1 hypothetical protein CbuQ195_00390 [Coxiella burnetii]PNT81727.1 hypothetical protein C2L91_03200 [Coxiella burnetii]
MALKRSCINPQCLLPLFPSRLRERLGEGKKPQQLGSLKTLSLTLSSRGRGAIRAYVKHITAKLLEQTHIIII